MHIYYELPEIPLPKYARPDGYRVYMNSPIENGKISKMYIGEFANKELGTMYVNDNFRIYCPSDWIAAYGEDHAPHYQYRVGMYATTLKLSHKNKLYDIIHGAFGPLYGNALVDFSMYSILERSNVAYRFKPAMEHEVIFSRKRFDDKWLSDAFGTEITIDQIHKFRLDWMLACKARGILKVWLSIDGSNHDNECEQCELSTEGHNKSGENKDCIGYLYAISAEDGTPVTYTTYYGDKVDSKAFLEMCELISSVGLEIEGVILDRGFLTYEVLSLIIEKQFQFIVMLKDDTFAHTNMVTEYGSEIYWNVTHLIGEDGLFGISSNEPRKIFKDYDIKAYINLYFDAKNGSERKITFVNKLYAAIVQIQKDIDEGKTPTVPSKMQKYLSIEEVPVLQEPSLTKEPEQSKVEQDSTMLLPSQADDKQQESNPGQINTPTSENQENTSSTEQHQKKYKIVSTDACNKRLYKKGFSSIASSVNYGPQRIHKLYHLRDSSEKQFMVNYSMLGGHVTRAHTEEGILCRGAIIFISAIIRNDIAKVCEILHLKTSIMLTLIDRPCLVLLANGKYKYINDQKDDSDQFFEYIGYTQDDFETIAGDVNDREMANGKGVSQYHRTAEEIREAHRMAREKNKKDRESKKDYSDIDQPVEEDNNLVPVVAPVVHKRPGRPKGRKNNKTLEKEAAAKENGQSVQVKGKPGRPKGRKNNATIAKEEAGILPKPKRPRGRPIGSKDSTPRKRRTNQEINAEKAAI